jgi:preprotein translocase subunit YajC
MTTTDPLFGMFLALGGAQQGQGNPLLMLLPWAFIIAIFYFIILLPMKKRQKKVEEFLAALKTGDKVVTSGGLFGSIAKINDDVVQLQIAPNVRVDISRAAIVGYQGQAPVVETPNT